MAAEERDELEWAAFRYVAGEMAPNEAELFERRLASDQDARESVSRAVALSLRLAAANTARDAQMASQVHGMGQPPALVAPRTQRSVVRAGHALGWMAAGAAAASLIFWLVRPSTSISVETTEGKRGTQIERTSAVADPLAWAQLRTSHDSAQTESWLYEPEPQFAAVSSDPARALALPHWVFTVAAQSSQGDKP